MTRFWKSIAFVAVLALAGPVSALTINGAGSTFIYPIASKWFYEYDQKTGVQINYQSVGSGAGIHQLLAGTVDFGASDAYMTVKQMSEFKGGPILNIPDTMGAVVISYNIPNIPTGLKLDAHTLAAIYLGDVTNWNDPAIAALNPGLTLPDLAITVAHRADGSGTTNIFTNYLSKVSPQWAAKVGWGTAVNWPVGVGGKGNEAVAGVVGQISGAIGYVEFAYVLQNHMAYALMKNRSGAFVAPSIKSVSSAAAGALANMPGDFRVYFTDAPGKGSYPICGFSWLLVPQHQTDSAKGATMVKFLRWAMHEGQAMAPSLDYVPLPPSLVKKIDKKIGTITY